jgi:DNA polymerase III epsilon subunit-like protein
LSRAVERRLFQGIKMVSNYILDGIRKCWMLTYNHYVDADKPKDDTTNTASSTKRNSNSLKNLAKKYLSRDIQMSGRDGHDSLEDAVAARDLVHYQILDLNEAGLRLDSSITSG